MATVYLHQDAGFSLTEDHFGDDLTAGSTRNWTITYVGTVGWWTMWHEDGTKSPVWLIPGDQGSPYTWDWNLSGPDVVPGRFPKITRTKLGPDGSHLGDWMDAEWSEATTGHDLSDDPPAVAFYDLANPSGRGTYPNDTNLRYIRDLSGFERTMDPSATRSAFGSVAVDMRYVATDPSIHFHDAECFGAPPFASPAQWTLIVRAKFADAGVPHSIVGTAGTFLDSVGLGVDSGNHVYATTINSGGGLFTATSTTPIDPTGWHTYYVSRSSDTLAVSVDDVPHASIPVTGAPFVGDVSLGMNIGTRDGAVTEAWYKCLKLYSEADHHEPGRVSLAPSPGGVLTATSEPRSRVRLGMSVSPDGGSP